MMVDTSDLDLMRRYLRASATRESGRGVTVSWRTARLIAEWLDDYAEIVAGCEGAVLDNPTQAEQRA